MKTIRLAANTNLVIKRGDITKEDTEAIVNAANSRLLGGGGVDGAIHRAAGPSLLNECRKIGWCEPGEAVVTSGGRLKARFVIHTVGPVWRGGTRNEDRVLERAYLSSLRRAMEKGVRTVAFPAISTGAYGFPADRAARTSLAAVRKFVEANPEAFDEIRFVLFSSEMYRQYERAMDGLA